MAYKAIQSSRLYEQIVQQIEASVRQGTLKEGDQLPSERELSQQFGVSRTAVREAIQALCQKGVVAAYAGRGTFITNISSPMRQLDQIIKGSHPQALSYLAEIREILEPEIAGLAAARAEQQHLTTMREAIAIMDQAGHDAESFTEADLDFHLSLAEAAANPLVLSLIDSIVGLLRQQRMGIFEVPGGPERGQYHHKRILNAVEHRDALGAREAMKAHLLQVREDSRGPAAE